MLLTYHFLNLPDTYHTIILFPHFLDLISVDFNINFPIAMINLLFVNYFEVEFVLPRLNNLKKINANLFIRSNTKDLPLLLRNDTEFFRKEKYDQHNHLNQKIHEPKHLFQILMFPMHGQSISISEYDFRSFVSSSNIFSISTKK